MTIAQAFQTALQHHQCGRIAEAEALYRQILAAQPEHADALHLLGVIADHAGHHADGAALIAKAISLLPGVAAFHSNLGEAFRKLGRHDEAAAVFRRAIGIDPGLPEAHNNLAAVLKEQGHPDEAIASCGRALKLRPDFPEAHNNLGNALRDLGRLDESMSAYRRVIALRPDFAEAYSNLGNALRDQGRLDEALAACQRAMQLRADLPELHSNMGNVLRNQGRLDEAESAFLRALELNPNFAEGHSNLGNVLRTQGRLDEAAAAYRRAIQLKPDFAEAHTNLGNVLSDQCHLDLAVASLRSALKLKPGNAAGHSNLLLLLHYRPDADPAEIFSEHRRWDEVHALPLAKLIAPHENDRTPDRRLRIGHVSPDFREHSAAFFTEGLLAAYDPEKVEVFCYADLLREDGVTARFRLASSHWRRITGMSDAEVARMIRTDKIDILVDLAGHTASNRLLVFARKPAPVQTGYLGYCDTTGLRAMDWRITDAYCDPPGSTEQFHSESLLRLPDVFACFRPWPDSPPVQPLPALTRGHVTFASFHIPAKLNDDLLASWARILHLVPSSRLLIATAGINEGALRGRLKEFFTAKGIASERLEFHGEQPLAGYLALHNSVDVLLDSFPSTGHTIACHALWMGVPAVTLAGRTHFSRMVGSVLNALGLPDLIATDADEYVEIAAKLSQDFPRLAALRGTLRERMRASPVTDAPRFARNVEAAFRQMWMTWCAKPCSIARP